MINLPLWGLDPESHKSKREACACSLADVLPRSQRGSWVGGEAAQTSKTPGRVDLSQEMRGRTPRRRQWDLSWGRIPGKDIFSHCAQDLRCWRQEV